MELDASANPFDSRNAALFALDDFLASSGSGVTLAIFRRKIVMNTFPKARLGDRLTTPAASIAAAYASCR